MIHKYYDTLFNADESVCWGKTVYDTAVCPLAFFTDTNKLYTFVSINPLKVSRADANVTEHRNILCEFDTGTITEQADALQASGLPYSTLVYSGSKSLHAIVSLEYPCKDRAEYDALVKRIYDKLPNVDKSGKNPSRFSRAPNAIRDNGMQQSLMEVRQRIPWDVLDLWLGPEPKTEQPKYVYSGSKLLPTRTRAFLKYGAPEGQRNRLLFSNSMEMLRAGYDEDEIFDLVSEILDLPQKEIRATIKSAVKKARASD